MNQPGKYGDDSGGGFSVRVEKLLPPQQESQFEEDAGDDHQIRWTRLASPLCSSSASLPSIVEAFKPAVLMASDQLFGVTVWPEQSSLSPP